MNLICGNCLTVMPTISADSFDAVVTDPPYGLSFRGESWDHGVPGEAFWRAALRVAKPGAFMLAFGGTRTFHRLTCAIEDSGWEIRDCLMWLYGQGFPKSKGVLKPGWEPIILARRPAPAPVLQIDACRLDAAPRTTHAAGNKQGTHPAPMDWGKSTGHTSKGADGRWPANVMLDEEAAVLLDDQTGMLAGGAGGGSQFFYVAKAGGAERTHNGTIENKHSTVKPIALMRWLVRLITPSGGRVLDPFCGSGSTGVACGLEGFGFTGIDSDEASIMTARARCSTTIDGDTKVTS